jgi:PKD repeat protein
MKRMWAAIAVLIALGMLIAGCPSNPENKKPTANMAADKVVMFVGGNTTFNGSLSKDSDGKVKDYIWSFGDGSADQTVKDKTINHNFTAAGAFNVTLYVKDDKGAKSKTAASAIVVVAPLPISTASVVDTSTVITFSIDNTSIGKYVTDYSWDFGDGSSVGKGGSANHSYVDNGSFKVSLTIVYKGQSASPASPITITVQNRPPVANISIGSVAPYYTNKPISFSGAGSGDSDGTIKTYYWLFGDQTNASGVTVTHAYTIVGNYTVTLTVTDNDGATASANLTLTIEKDMIIKSVSVETYVDPANYTRANLSIKIENKGEAKGPGTIRVNATSYTANKSVRIDSNSTTNGGTWEPNTPDNSISIRGLLPDGTNINGTWYFVEVFYQGNVVDSGWYQKS